jgi:hypothetical protein
LDLYMKMMKYILDKKGTVNLEGIKTAKTFSWQNTAREMIKCLKK